MRYLLSDLSRINDIFNVIMVNEKYNMSLLMKTVDNKQLLDKETNFVLSEINSPTMMNFMDELFAIGQKYALKADGKIVKNGNHIVVDPTKIKLYEADIKDLYKRKRMTYFSYISLEKRLKEAQQKKYALKFKKYDTFEVLAVPKEIVDEMRKYKLLNDRKNVISRAVKIWAKLFKRRADKQNIARCTA